MAHLTELIHYRHPLERERHISFFFCNCIDHEGKELQRGGKTGEHIQFLFQGCCIGGHRLSSSSSSRILRRWPDQSCSAESSPQLKFSNCKAECSESGKFFLHVGAAANMNPLVQTPYHKKKKKEMRAKKKGKSDALKCLN